MIDKLLAKQAWSLILEAKKIVIISHRSPDPDAIGSNLALVNYLKSLHKSVTPVSVDIIPKNCHFLPLSDQFVTTIDFENLDLIISVDCGSKSQVAFESKYPDLFQKNIPFINIDHHISNDNFGTLNLVYTNLSSTCEIITSLFDANNIKMTPEIATCLLAGLYYDTGSFMHSNTSESTLKCAEKLLSCNADLPTIISQLLKQTTTNKLKLWGKAIESIQIKENHSTTTISTKDFQETGANSEDTSGLIDLLSSIENLDYTHLITTDNGKIKNSLRTQKNDINLSEKATTFGGGGHKKASGFVIQGKLNSEEIITITLN